MFRPIDKGRPYRIDSLGTLPGGRDGLRTELHRSREKAGELFCRMQNRTSRSGNPGFTIAQQYVDCRALCDLLEAFIEADLCQWTGRARRWCKYSASKVVCGKKTCKNVVYIVAFVPRNKAIVPSTPAMKTVCKPLTSVLTTC